MIESTLVQFLNLLHVSHQNGIQSQGYSTTIREGAECKHLSILLVSMVCTEGHPSIFFLSPNI